MQDVKRPLGDEAEKKAKKKTSFDVFLSEYWY